MHRAVRAFTLVEILIVVVILGILAAIVLPLFSGATEEARRAAFVSELRIYTDAAQTFRAREGLYLEDSGSGVLPTGFDEYINAEGWLDGTPLGGVWDSEFNSYGFTSSLGVHWNGDTGYDDAYMTIVDALIDDGDLAAGAFQKIDGDRYYAIIEE